MTCHLPRTDLLVREVEGETVILDRERDLIHTLNPTASLVWHALQRQSSLQVIIESMVETFDIDYATAATDVTRAVEHFRDLHLMQANHAGGAHEQE